MLVLLAMSVLAVAIVMFKGFELARLRLQGLDFVEPVMTALEKGRLDDARASIDASRHPVAQVLRSSVDAALDPLISPQAAQAEVARVGSRAVRELESWLRGLSAIAHLSPLLGLLGTVIGMIMAFMKIQDAGSSVDPSVLSGGIWQALLTTAFGLTVAIPAMAAFYLLEGEIDRVRAAMKDVSVRVLVRYDKLAIADPLDENDRVAESSYGV